MEQAPNLKTLIFSLFLILILTCSVVHSSNPASSPSPAPAPANNAALTNRLNPYRGRKENPMRRSFPATCHSKCNECQPCMPVEVSIPTMELEEYENYYPMVWKCMCQHNIFSP
ncbi:EPIDERMAL PATTERNING FACTOR-like protein 8 [Quillaja saponaria]|uniref:Epidermal patterning factor-like protein n=1 Tax=Quillaja saponaria TaxID=32244 RepID=A0AAD7KUP9_QUISA|nr:EPIDERMAL PATTERNING FACTOR-like protein 8 [Quillaja saponaria]